LEDLEHVTPLALLSSFEFLPPYRILEGVRQEGSFDGMMLPSYKATPQSIIGPRVKVAIPGGEGGGAWLEEKAYERYVALLSSRYFQHPDPEERARQLKIRFEEDVLQFGWLDKFGYSKGMESRFAILSYEDKEALLISDHIPSCLTWRLKHALPGEEGREMVRCPKCDSIDVKWREKQNRIRPLEYFVLAWCNACSSQWRLRESSEGAAAAVCAKPVPRTQSPKRERPP